MVTLARRTDGSDLSYGSRVSPRKCGLSFARRQSRYNMRIEAIPTGRKAATPCRLPHSLSQGGDV
uniref:Uncharacterized protein n=1 Tax=Podoviridae sp. cti6G1 TaxID=2826570 RepID=A0A8S5LUB5_9CAUD|nr:MAG TPA: hypothetical protein [Podoviridae sp. cti6G1]